MDPAFTMSGSETDFSGSFNFFFQSLLQNSPNGIVAIDTQYKALFWNPYMEQLTGKKKEEVLHKSIFESFPHLQDLGMKEVYDRTFQGEATTLRNIFRKKEGKDFHYEGHYYPITGNSKEIIGCICILMDITHLIQSETELQHSYSLLKENEEKIQETYTVAEIGNWERNLLTGETNWEEFLCNKIYEIPPHYERTFEGFIRLVHPEDKEGVRDKVARIIQHESEDRNFHYRIITPQGKLKYISSYTKPVFDKNGNPHKVRGYSQNITRLKESEMLLKTVVDNCFHGIVFVKPQYNGELIIDFECILGNQVACEMINQGNSNIQGKWLTRDLYYNDHETGMFQANCEVYRTGIPLKKTHYYPGFNKWFSLQIIKLMDGLLINFADITESKNMEQSLLELNRDLEEKVKARTADLIQEKEQFKTLAEAIPQLVFISTANSYEYVNVQWSRFLAPGDAGNTAKWWELLHPEDMEQTGLRWQEANEKGIEFNTEYRLRRDDGEYIWFMARAIPIKDESGNVLRWFGTCTDIHKIKEAERALKMHSTILTNMAEGVCVADHNGILTYTNPAFEKIFGYESGELVGQHVFDLNEVYEGSKENIDMVMQTVIDKGHWAGEIRNRKKDNSPFFTYAHINSINIHGEQHFIAVQDDITELKNHEKLLKENAEQQQKLNTELSLKNSQLVRINQDLDNFVYTASHDLKAPVSNIEALMHVLGESMSKETLENQEVQDVLSMIGSSIQRFKGTINDLTDITKVAKNGEEEEEELVDIHELVDDICCGSIKNLIDTHKPHITRDYEVDQIRFSRKNLRSIFYNLISNGIKYKSPDRHPVINIVTQRTENNGVLISVTDNGLGIPATERGKLFRMYKRLHQHVEGSGIGLYIVKRIIDNAGGKIEVESEEGKGTKFKVFFKAKEN